MPHEQMSVGAAQDNGLKTITPESDQSSQTGSEETDKPTNATVSRDKMALKKPSKHLLPEALQEQPVKKMRISNFEHSLQTDSRLPSSSSERFEERSVSVKEVGFKMPHEQMSVGAAQDNGLKTITPESDQSSQTGSEETDKSTNATVSRDKMALKKPSKHLLPEALQEQPVKKMRISNFEHSLQTDSTMTSTSSEKTEERSVSLNEVVFKMPHEQMSFGAAQDNGLKTITPESDQSSQTGSEETDKPTNATVSRDKMALKKPSKHLLPEAMQEQPVKKMRISNFEHSLQTGSSLPQVLTRSISLIPNFLHKRIKWLRTQKKTFEHSSFLQRSPSFITIRKNAFEDSALQMPIPKEREIAQERDETDVSAPVHKKSGTSGPKDIAKFGTCIECVKPVPVSSLKEIEVGDHIIFPGAVYDHHGIVVGKPEGGSLATIVEATNTISGVAVGFPFGRKAILSSSDKAFDFSKQKIWVVYYRNRLYSKQEVAERAVKYVENEKEKYKYNLMANNCEHFATYCVTGEKFSIQVTKLRLTLRLLLSKGFLGISDENVRNKHIYENKIICGRCFEMNKSLLSVNAKPITKSSDVKEGDVIKYRYWNLWHDAVVLKVKDEHQKYVVCEIAHYAFCGVFSYRKIKAEPLQVSFDGKCKKLEYVPPKYDVYDPKNVVERAKSRLGEQEFVFFSNDSSHYARWCKLKLIKPVEELHSEVVHSQ